MPQGVDFLEIFLFLNQFLGPPHGALCTPRALEGPVRRLRGRKSMLQDPFNPSFVHHFKENHAGFGVEMGALNRTFGVQAQ